MFRSKKTPHAEPALSSPDAIIDAGTIAVGPDDRAGPRNTASRVSLPRPMLGAPFPIDIPRRTPETIAPARSEAVVSSNRDKTMIIGNDVRLKGEVFACDKLVVDGDGDLQVSGCRHLQIGASGRFAGEADVSDADVAGLFEGNLVVRDRLTLRSSGRIKGSVRYGQIVIEAGGQLSGDVAAGTEATTTWLAGDEPKVAKAI